MKNYLCFFCLIVSSYSEKLESGNEFYVKGTSYSDVLKQGLFIENNRFQDGKGQNIGDILNNKNLGYNTDYGKIRGEFERDEYHFGLDAGNPDIHGERTRPCQIYDTFCIRKFFAEHSRCKISGRRLPDPFYRAQGNLNYPSANITVSSVDLEYGGLNAARVEEFYINKKTDNLVIAINFDAVSLASKNNNAKFYLRGREPIVTQDVGALVFVQTTVTFVIPGLDDLRLDRAEIYTYGENPVVPFAVGPRLGITSDPEVEAMFLYFATVNVPIEHLEELSTEGVFYGTNYLQYNICDFGLKVI